MEILSRKTSGYFSVVLHAHLPYVRYPDHEYFLEERWLYEAMTETYIPLIRTLADLLSDGVDFRITLSLSPTLLSMFKDGLLMDRYRSYLARLIELTEREVFRTRRDSALAPVAKMYRERFLEIRDLFEKTYRGDLPSAFRSLSASGKVELMTSAATHAYLPALMVEPVAVRAQVMLGADCFESTFGAKPAGIWLPECGFTPAMDEQLGEAGTTYFFLESHGLLNSVPRRRCGTFSPARTPSGIVAFSRDSESSGQVWSSQNGYPGDFDYRDFYRDIGFDLDSEYLAACLPEGVRTFTGIKYYRITGKSGAKKPYVRARALRKARIHARHFLSTGQKRVVALRRELGIRPLITAAYDAELFGHWWFEGPEWLDFLFRKRAKGKNSFTFITPSEYIAENGEMDIVLPSLSSWGEGGYSSTWINPSTAPIYRYLHRAAKTMRRSAYENAEARGLMRRALNQALRELLLAQSSDWPFMMKTGNASEFGRKKFSEHMENFFLLQREIAAGSIRRADLLALERKNNLFPDIDFRVYAGSVRQTGSSA